MRIAVYVLQVRPAGWEEDLAVDARSYSPSLSRSDPELFASLGLRWIEHRGAADWWWSRELSDGLQQDLFFFVWGPPQPAGGV